MSAFKKLKELVAAAVADATAFYEKGNKAAGTRLRKSIPGNKKYSSSGAGRSDRTERQSVIAYFVI
jgi:hypothetical protein